MKTIFYYIIALVFTSPGLMTDAGSTITDEFKSEKVSCEQYCPDYDDDFQDTDCSNVCSGSNSIVCQNEEGYIDDIPFDTKEVVENVDTYETDSKVEKEQDEEVTIFKLFIKWVSLLFQIN